MQSTAGEAARPPDRHQSRGRCTANFGFQPGLQWEGMDFVGSDASCADTGRRCPIQVPATGWQMPRMSVDLQTFVLSDTSTVMAL